MTALKDSELARLGVRVAHHFGGGAYIKETFIPAGAMLAQHAHAHTHLSYLVGGQVELEIDGERCFHGVPTAFVLEAGKVHAVHARTDAVWLCVWPTDCTDPRRIDEALLERAS